jgi:hypothetical protein
MAGRFTIFSRHVSRGWNGKKGYNDPNHRIRFKVGVSFSLTKKMKIGKNGVASRARLNVVIFSLKCS